MRIFLGKFSPPRCVAAWLVLALATFARAEFRDDFNHPIVRDPTGVQNWTFHTGDGAATIAFTAANGIGTVTVDATKDRRNIWWALIKRQISAAIDLAKLAEPRTELRVEARVRSSHAPRRINLSFNTQRTTDFHTNLMEFDLAEPNVWQTISFTTQDFDARPGDRVNAQLALIDWGLGKYQLEVDYFKVAVVDPVTAGADLGTPVPYRPPIPDPKSFRHALAAAHNATIDRREPDANLHDWSALATNGRPTSILTVNGTQHTILRWELGALAGKKAAGSGLLELRTHSVQRPATRRKDFGMLRVVEILDGDPRWDERAVSYDKLAQGKPYEDVFNPQMIIDVEVNDTPDASTLITLSRPVLQRLLDGRTKGIALIPLGSINAAFLTRASAATAPKLHFNLQE